MSDELAKEIYKALDVYVIAMPEGTGRSAAIDTISRILRPHIERHERLREEQQARIADLERQLQEAQDKIQELKDEIQEACMKGE